MIHIPAFLAAGPLRTFQLPQTNHCPHSHAPTRACAVSRRQALRVLAAGAAAISLSPNLVSNAAEATTTSSGLQYTVTKKGDGPAPSPGDLMAIRFRGSYNGVVFDDIFNTPEPYFYRLGSGSILKGIDEALHVMRVGDVLSLKIPSDLAFGKKGRRASAGKPSIPPNAAVDYDVSLVELPGKQEELIEVTGGEEESGEIL